MTSKEFVESIRLEGEEWMPIHGYESLYMVSNYGRIISLDRAVNALDTKRTRPYSMMRKPKLRKPASAGQGYLHIGLRGLDGSYKKFYIHRLVAEHFIPNPDNLPYVNHKDGKPALNNRADNLEWCTQSYNVNYLNTKIRQREAANKDRGRQVAHTTEEGTMVYPSVREAARQNWCDHKTISNYCKAGIKGWHYVPLNTKE